MIVVLRVNLKIRAELATAIAALQIEKHRLREGAWPDSMADVYDTAPVGPYGHPLQVTQHGPQRRVYSIGVNGIDDSGIDQLDDESVTSEEDDRAFILLDPAERNRPATTTIDPADNQSTARPSKDLGE